MAPSTPEQRVPKTTNGEGVKSSRKQGTATKSSAPDGRLCFRCGQPGHLKKDCPEPPYCSKCKTKGHIPVKCPLMKQGNRQLDKRCKSVNQGTDERCKSHREDLKKAQDQPQFYNRDNKCLNCVANHRTCDCPIRQQPQASTISNPANGTGIYQNNPQIQNVSPQQHSQQSQSTVGTLTPTLMVNNPQFQSGLQGQAVNQQTNLQVRPQQFNQQFQQSPVPQVSPLMAPPHPYNPQVLPPYYPQYPPPPSNNPSVTSNDSLVEVLNRQLDMQERMER